MTRVADGILWVPESALSKITGVARSSLQSWDSDGIIDRPSSGAFRKLHVVEALICKTVRAELSLNATRNGMQRLRQDQLESIVERVRDPRKVAFVDLVVNTTESAFEACFSQRELLRAVRDPRRSRTSVVTPLGQVFADAMQVFENEANRGSPPSVRKRGRPSKDEQIARVIPLRGE